MISDIPHEPNKKVFPNLPEKIRVRMIKDLKVDDSNSEYFAEMEPVILALIKKIEASQESKNPLRIVEFGCGDSLVSYLIAQSLAEYYQKKIEYVGIDISEQAIKKINQEVQKLQSPESYCDAQFIACDASKLERWFKKGMSPFDMAIMISPIVEDLSNPKVKASINNNSIFDISSLFKFEEQYLAMVRASDLDKASLISLLPDQESIVWNRFRDRSADQTVTLEFLELKDDQEAGKVIKGLGDFFSVVAVDLAIQRDTLRRLHAMHTSLLSVSKQNAFVEQMIPEEKKLWNLTSASHFAAEQIESLYGLNQLFNQFRMTDLHEQYEQFQLLFQTFSQCLSPDADLVIQTFHEEEYVPLCETLGLPTPAQEELSPHKTLAIAFSETRLPKKSLADDRNADAKQSIAQEAETKMSPMPDRTEYLKKRQNLEMSGESRMALRAIAAYVEERNDWATAFNNDKEREEAFALLQKEYERIFESIKSHLKSNSEKTILLDLPLSKTGNTALMSAVILGSPEAVKIILENGASLDKRNFYGNTALEIAIGERKPVGGIIKLLLDHTAKNLKPEHEDQVLKLLYSAVSKHDSFDENTVTLLKDFLLENFPEKYKLGSKDRNNLIIELVKRGDIKTAQSLIEDVNCQEDDAVVKKFIELLQNREQKEETPRKSINSAIFGVCNKGNVTAAISLLTAVEKFSDKGDQAHENDNYLIEHLSIVLLESAKKKQITAIQAGIILKKITPMLKPLPNQYSFVKDDALRRIQGALRTVMGNRSEDIVKVFLEFDYPPELQQGIIRMANEFEFRIPNVTQPMRDLIDSYVKRCENKETKESAAGRSSSAFFHSKEENSARQPSSSTVRPTTPGKTLK